MQFMSLRNIGRHRTRSVVFGLLIFLSSLVIFVLMSISTSIEAKMNEAVVGAVTGDLQLHPWDMADFDIYNSPVADTPVFEGGDAAAADLLTGSLPIADAAPRLRMQGLLVQGDQSTGITLTGVVPSVERQISRKIQIVEGGPIERPDDLLVGQRIFREMNLAVGDHVSFYTGTSETDVHEARFRIVGTFTADGLSTFMDSNLMADLGYLRKSMGLTKQETTEVVITLAQGAGQPEALRAVNARLAAAGSPLEARPWQSVAKMYAGIITASTGIPYIAITLVLIVVLIGLLNSIIMTILERSRENRILIAMGTMRAAVYRLIAAEFGVLSLVATLAAVGVGTAAIVVLNRVGLRAPSEILEYVFGGRVLHPAAGPFVYAVVLGVFAAVPALVAWLAAALIYRRPSLTNMNQR